MFKGKNYFQLQIDPNPGLENTKNAMLAFRAGNSDAVADLFVENGELNIVDSPPIKGKSNIASFLKDKSFPDDVSKPNVVQCTESESCSYKFYYLKGTEARVAVSTFNDQHALVQQEIIRNNSCSTGPTGIFVIFEKSLMDFWLRCD